jgi:hypothetical protein
LILAAVSGAAGLALGRIVPRRTRRLLLVGGVAAAVLAAALAWSSARGSVPGDLTVLLAETTTLGTAVLLIAFALGAGLTGP